MLQADLNTRSGVLACYPVFVMRRRDLFSRSSVRARGDVGPRDREVIPEAGMKHHENASQAHARTIGTKEDRQSQRIGRREDQQSEGAFTRPL